MKAAEAMRANAEQDEIESMAGGDVTPSIAQSATAAQSDSSDSDSDEDEAGATSAAISMGE